MGKYFVIAFLSICNVVWFYNFNLGTLKTGLIVMLVAFNYRIFLDKKNYVGFPLFIGILLTIVISIYAARPKHFDTTYYLYGFIENYLFLILGYAYARKGMINQKFLKSLLWVIVPLCVLIISNFLIGFPGWHSPAAIEFYERKLSEGYLYGFVAPLYSTGFGIARTGWANSLCQFLPIAIAIKMRSKRKVLILVILYAAVFASASRGGMLCSLSILLVYLMKILRNRNTKISIAIVFFLIVLVIFNYWDSVSQYLRLDDKEDISTGRADQYLLLPLLFNLYSWQGLGVGTIEFIFRAHGLDFTLHNTYLKLILETGIPFTILFLIALSYIFYYVYKGLTHKKPTIAILSLICMSGLISCLMEPKAVFGSANWYALWWFFLGFIIFQVNKSRNIILRKETLERQERKRKVYVSPFISKISSSSHSHHHSAGGSSPV